MSISQLALGHAVVTRSLRPYQAEAVAAIEAAHRAQRSALLVLPTGTGKTRTFGELARIHRDAGRRTLVVAHSVVLVNQAARALQDLGLTVGIEQAGNRVTGFPPQAVIATVQTMRGKRMQRYARDHFGLVVVDEAHRSLGKQHRDVIAHFSGARVLGVTATPDRTDGAALANVFETCAYEMTLRQAIADGWLAPLTVQTVHSGWDPSRLKTVAGECDPSSVEAELTRSGLLDEAASALAELVGEGKRKSVVAFLPTVASARAFAAIMHARGVSAASVDGSTPEAEREKVFDAYQRGDVQLLSNCAVLVEGWDAPHTDCIALLSPTKSRSRLAQCIGRGTRLFGGKADCLVLDFVAGRMSSGRLAAPVDALAGRMLTDDELNGVRDGDAMQSLEAAELEGERLKQLREAAAVEEEERRRRLDRIRDNAMPTRAAFSVERHDTTAILEGGDDVPPMRSHQSYDPKLSDEARKAAGLPSTKQAAILRRCGFDPNMSRADAGYVMSVLAKSGWKWPGTKPARLVRPAG